MKRHSNMEEIAKRIRDFIGDNFLFGDFNGFNDDTSFLGEGIIDSTGALELVSFIEETFNIHVEDDELIPEYLDSIHNITGYLGKKLHV